MIGQTRTERTDGSSNFLISFLLLFHNNPRGAALTRNDGAAFVTRAWPRNAIQSGGTGNLWKSSRALVISEFSILEPKNAPLYVAKSAVLFSNPHFEWRSYILPCLPSLPPSFLPVLSALAMTKSPPPPGATDCNRGC